MVPPYRITRKAILIGCPGPVDNYLRGVQPDLANMGEFICSERGGKFYPNEVTSLFNPTLADISEVIHSAIADYTIVYFSGHGYTDNQGNRMLCLKDCSIRDTYLLNKSPRQLVIVDACRNYLFGDTIGAIGGLSDLYDNATGSPVRALFDEWIYTSPAGRLIIHATAPGTSAGDSNSGGIFTKALLKVAKNCVTNMGYVPVAPHYVVENVYNILATQYPTIVYSSGQLTVPFAVGKPQEFIPAYVPQVHLQKQQPPSTAGTGVGLIFLGLLIVGLVAAK